jgi:hypothetical protein
MHGDRWHGWDWEILLETGNFPCDFRFCWVCKSIMFATPDATKRHCDTEIHRAYIDRFCMGPEPARIGPSGSVPQPPPDGRLGELMNNLDFDSCTLEELLEAKDILARAREAAVQERLREAPLYVLTCVAKDFVASQEKTFETLKKAIKEADLIRRVSGLSVVAPEEHTTYPAPSDELKSLCEFMEGAGLGVEMHPILSMYLQLSQEDREVLHQKGSNIVKPEDAMASRMLQMRL